MICIHVYDLIFIVEEIVMNNNMDLAFTSQLSSSTMLETTFSVFSLFLFSAYIDQGTLSIYVNISTIFLEHLSYANSPKSSVD